MRFQEETLYEAIDEVRPLLAAHWRELGLDRHGALDPDWARYAALEQSGAFAGFSARDDAGRLVGYSAFFVQPDLHRQGLSVAQSDALFLRPDCRRGAVGLALIRYSEQRMRERGVDQLVWCVSPMRDLRPMLHRMGYRDDTIACLKNLRESTPCLK